MKRIVGLLALLLLAASCDAGRRYDQAIAVLIDVSGTYADERPEAVKLIKRDVLPAMVPGDTLIVIRIDSDSYEKSNVEAMLTLDPRPSRANAQKLSLARALDTFATRDADSQYSDIPGAMMLAAEYLSELRTGSRVMLILSDMWEDLPQGTRRQMGDTEFEGIRIAAMNVKRLRGDTADPDVFRERLARWEERVTVANATEWRTFLDATQLPTYLEQIR
jgi:hypothetical protein